MIDPIGQPGIEAGAMIHGRAVAGQRLAGPSFGAVLADEIHKVELLQRSAAQAAASIPHGTSQDVAAALDAARKADNAFRLLMEVRTHVLEAYEEIKQIRF